jgi:hypothetical protein
MLHANSSSNLTLHQNSSWYFQFFKLCQVLNSFCITMITLVGLYGNTMSIVIFFRKSYSKNSLKSLKIYLVVLSITYLLIIIFINFEYGLNSWANVFNSNVSVFNLIDDYLIACRLIPYVVTGLVYFSIYTFVALMLQRVIIFTEYNTKFNYNSVKFNKRLLSSIFVLSFACSSYKLFMVHMDVEKDKSLCTWSLDKLTIGIFAFSIIFLILIPFVSVLAMSIILHQKVRYFQTLMKQTSTALTQQQQQSDQTSLNESFLFSEVRRCTIYLNYLDEQYPQVPGMLFGLRSSSLSITHRNSMESRRHFKKLSHSIYISAMIASISKYFLILNLPYLIIMFVYKVYQKHASSSNSHQTNDLNVDVFAFNYKDDEDQNDDMAYLFKGLLKLAEVCAFTNCAIHFFIYLLYGKSFRREHKKMVFNCLQLAYYLVVSIVAKPYQLIQNVFS